MRVFVTGGAGFIGSNLVERLLADAHSVTAFDNLSLGRRENLTDCFKSGAFRLIVADLLDLPAVEEAVASHDVVFHLAANSDIGEGRRQTDIDLRQGTLATYNVLEAMRRTGVRQIVFSSSSVVYGEAKVLPTPEDYGPLFPISLYGASKLACEGLISAFCHNYNLQGWIFRFANICGRHGTHGAIVDFIRKLQQDSRHLEILGDGRQAKPNLHVTECVDGILYGWRTAREQLNCFNLGCEGATTAGHIARLLIAAMGLRDVNLFFTGGQRGWPGDVPQVRLDCTKLKRLGWQAKLTSDEAVKRATEELVEEILVQAVILAGGLGTRLRPLTERVPKPMVEVGGRPFVEYIIKHLGNQGLRRILMLVGYLGEQIESHFADGARYGVAIQYAKEPRPLGTAGALRNTLAKLDEEFLLLYGDSYLPIDYRPAVGAFRQAGSLGLMVVYDNQAGNTDVQENVATDSAGWVTQYLKGQEAPTLRYVEAGVLCFRRAVFSTLPPEKVISLEHEIFPWLIARRQLFSFVSDHRFYDIGTPWRLEEFASRQP